jgi:hypothetical protein
MLLQAARARADSAAAATIGVLNSIIELYRG